MVWIRIGCSDGSSDCASCISPCLNGKLTLIPLLFDFFGNN